MVRCGVSFIGYVLVILGTKDSVEKIYRTEEFEGLMGDTLLLRGSPSWSREVGLEGS